jgi:chorismate-pyruvate lyase
MTHSPAPTVDRRRYGASATDQASRLHAERLLPLLLAQDGSTTRLCEVIVGGPVELQLVSQTVTSQVPAAVASQLPGQSHIERLSCLVAHDQVMMDNLAYIALEGLPGQVRMDLESGRQPIGHLLARLYVRRVPLPQLRAQLLPRLWAAVGEPDPAAGRTYLITTASGPLMLIAEAFRDGMLTCAAPADRQAPQ